jgi:hypothetical protein
MFHDDMDFIIRIVLYIVVISVLYIILMTNCLNLCLMTISTSV